MTPRRAFASGVAAGLGTGLLLIVVWLIFAFVIVDRRLDRQDAEAEASRLAEVELSAPDLAPVEPPEQAPYAWTVRSLAGDAVAMETFETRTVLLSLWHTECVPCRAQLPSLTRLAERLEGREDIVLLMVSPETEDVLHARLTGDVSDLPFFVADQIPENLRPNVWPTTHVIDCTGAVVARHVGGADWDSDDVVDFLAARARETCP